MDKLQLQHFCRRYFQATNTPILRDEPEFLQVELPREIDKELTDRPYFWMWAEATGEEVPPTVLHIVFDADTEVEGIESAELVALGSFRLEKIFESTTKRGRFVCVYQTDAPTMLRVPYLVTNLKISYIADRRKDEIRSFGVNLKSKQVISGLYEEILALPFADHLPNHFKPHALSGPFLNAALQDGWRQIKQTVREEIHVADHSWAEAAQERLELEMEQLDIYYQSLILENEEEMAVYSAERELRLAELKWRSQPRIQIAPLHFGILYLDPTQFTGISPRM